MSKRDEKVELYLKSSNDIGLGLDREFIKKVAIGLGPSIYKKDAETVSCSDPSELERIRKNFLQKKLGLTQADDELDAAIKEVCQQMGSSNKSKYRALFYALLAKKFNKESIYV